MKSNYKIVFIKNNDEKKELELFFPRNDGKIEFLTISRYQISDATKLIPRTVLPKYFSMIYKSLLTSDRVFFILNRCEDLAIRAVLSACSFSHSEYKRRYENELGSIAINNITPRTYEGALHFFNSPLNMQPLI